MTHFLKSDEKQKNRIHTLLTSLSALEISPLKLFTKKVYRKIILNSDLLSPEMKEECDYLDGKTNLFKKVSKEKNSIEKLPLVLAKIKSSIFSELSFFNSNRIFFDQCALEEKELVKVDLIDFNNKIKECFTCLLRDEYVAKGFDAFNCLLGHLKGYPNPSISTQVKTECDFYNNRDQECFFELTDSLENTRNNFEVFKNSLANCQFISIPDGYLDSIEQAQFKFIEKHHSKILVKT